MDGSPIDLGCPIHADLGSDEPARFAAHRHEDEMPGGGYRDETCVWNEPLVAGRVAAEGDQFVATRGDDGDGNADLAEARRGDAGPSTGDSATTARIPRSRNDRPAYLSSGFAPVPRRDDPCRRRRAELPPVARRSAPRRRSSGPRVSIGGSWEDIKRTAGSILGDACATATAAVDRLRGALGG